MDGYLGDLDKYNCFVSIVVKFLVKIILFRYDG